jgi:hypothetical protein
MRGPKFYLFGFVGGVWGAAAGRRDSSIIRFIFSRISLTCGYLASRKNIRFLGPISIEIASEWIPGLRSVPGILANGMRSTLASIFPSCKNFKSTPEASACALFSRHSKIFSGSLGSLIGPISYVMVTPGTAAGSERTSPTIAPEDFRMAVNCFAKACGSSPGTAEITTSNPWNLFRASVVGGSRTSSLGETAKAKSRFSWRSLSVSRANSAVRSFALAAPSLATAICAFALAISACAIPREAFACAVCASSATVLISDCSSRMLVVRHCNNRNAIVAHAPTAVITPPAKTPFQEMGYQYSAQSKSDGSIGTGWEPFAFFSAITLNIAAPHYLDCDYPLYGARGSVRPLPILPLQAPLPQDRLKRTSRQTSPGGIVASFGGDVAIAGQKYCGVCATIPQFALT